ncbi:hypothetical protein BSKO_11834 [Bryopsis sp. KO-2023]|nr:hypothetical protein BSKO_11834 [Bryopsis sp. KO-2023]
MEAMGETGSHHSSLNFPVEEPHPVAVSLPATPRRVRSPAESQMRVKMEREPSDFCWGDLHEDHLLRIMVCVLGPLVKKEHFLSNGIIIKHHHLEPTFLNNFADLAVLPQVCRRWRDIVKRSPPLWNCVNIDPTALGVPSESRSWQKLFQWLGPHSQNFRVLRMSDAEACRDPTRDQLKLGALCTLAHSVRVLHLDRCFHPSVGGHLVNVLGEFRNLTQLQVANINPDFIAKIKCLRRLSELKILEIQGSEDYWDRSWPMLSLSPNVLPSKLETLSLSNIKVLAQPSETMKFRYLSTLEVIYTLWYGDFVKAITRITGLKHLSVRDCDRAIDDDDDGSVDNEIPGEREHWREFQKLDQLESLDLTNLYCGNFTERLGKDLSGVSHLTALTSLKLCPEDIASLTPCVVGEGLSVLTQLRELHLVNFGMRDVPKEVYRLPLLEELSLAGNNLSRLPSEVPASSKTLKSIRLDINCFDEIPMELMYWENLTKVSLARNPLKFSKSLDFLADMRSLEDVILGQGHGVEVFPTGGTPLVERLCRDLKLETISAFHWGGLCTAIKLKKRTLRLLM